jgi:dTDP-4-dehydrorhamnose reductase
MRILIAGALGQLGRDVTEAARAQRHFVLALPRDELDISRAERVNQIIDANRPDLVINCAAYTAVDRAEKESERAFAVNRDGPSNLAAACAHGAIPLIHISTDYVFNGDKKTPYVESDPAQPINVYGLSKAAGETEVQNKTDRYVILRTAWVFGAHGTNFVKTMLKLGQARETIRVVDDQFGCPTFTGHLAGAIMEIAGRYHNQPDFPWGIYHYGGRPAVSWYQFAEQIFSTASEMGLPLQVRNLVAIPTSEYPTPAKRAVNSRLDCRKLKQVFGLKPASWHDGVRTVVEEYQASTPSNPRV